MISVTGASCSSKESDCIVCEVATAGTRTLLALWRFRESANPVFGEKTAGGSEQEWRLSRPGRVNKRGKARLLVPRQLGGETAMNI